MFYFMENALIKNQIVFKLSGMATFCVAGLLVTSQSIWRHCLNRRSHTPSHNSSADLQVSLNNSQQYSSIDSTLFPQQGLYIFWKLFLSLGHFRMVSVSTHGLTVCVFRKPYHHPEENPALSVVSWPLDMWILLSPCNRLVSAGPAEHDGAPACEEITVTSTYMFRNTHFSDFTNIFFGPFV